MRTPAELEDALDSSLAWRRHELHSLLSEARNAKGTAQVAVMRAGVALLYAHWEGFVKGAMTDYLRFVARRRLKFHELKPCFVALAVESEINRTQGQSAIRRRNATAERYFSLGEDERASIPVREADTQSNLNSIVLSDLFDSMGLDLSPLSTKAKLMDYNLLKSRNEIAHGQWTSISMKSYDELHHEVLSMIETVRNIVKSAVDNQSYRKAWS